MQINTYYDLRLNRVLSSDSKGHRLLMDYNAQELSLQTTAADAEQLLALMKSAAFPGHVGLARLIKGKANGIPGYYRFDPYPDQTLRRAPELDVFEYQPEGYNVNCIGWRCETNPAGFLAPRGIIPGVQGHFISDSTESFAVDVPYEFTDLCTRLHRNPVAVLRDFIANASKLHHTNALPRGDGFASHGHEAEALLARYLELVYQKPGN